MTLLVTEVVSNHGAGGGGGAGVSRECWEVPDTAMAQLGQRALESSLPPVPCLRL